jgi:LysM repeat protein
MSKKLFPVLLVVLIPVFFSCRTSKKLSSSTSKTQPVPVTQSAQDYINAYKDIAVSEMKRTGIPASITLAQGMVESDFGRSTLARNANNHFGIKCHNEWNGPSVIMDDDSKDECFRKYTSAENSFYDHSEFLKSRPRYSFLFDIDPVDYKAWAHGLKKAGYATNPDYPNMLIRKIEENNLMVFDVQDRNGKNTASRVSKPSDNRVGASSVVKGAPADTDMAKPSSSDAGNENTVDVVKNSNAGIPAPSGSGQNGIKNTPGNSTTDTPVNTGMAVYARAPRVKENNNIQYIIIKDNDTREKIEQEFSLLKWELPRYNDVEQGFELKAGEILYIQPKHERAEEGKEYYIFAEGDTMYGISQKYGIKLRSLYSMNRMTEGTQAEVGEKIWLRSTKPAE